MWMRWRQHASRNREVHVHSGLARSELSQHGPCCHAYQSWFLTGIQLPVVICVLSNTGSFPPLFITSMVLKLWKTMLGPYLFSPILCHLLALCLMCCPKQGEEWRHSLSLWAFPNVLTLLHLCGIRPSFANIQCHQPCTRWDLMIIRPWHWSGNLVGGQAYYPERLAKAFVVHVPTIFWGVWHMLSPFIDKVTREKVGFLFMPDKQIFSAELWI
jgi:hypothetical protein